MFVLPPPLDRGELAFEAGAVFFAAGALFFVTGALFFATGTRRAGAFAAFFGAVDFFTARVFGAGLGADFFSEMGIKIVGNRP